MRTSMVYNDCGMCLYEYPPARAVTNRRRHRQRLFLGLLGGLLQGHPHAGVLRGLPGGERIVSQHPGAAGPPRPQGHQGGHSGGDGRKRSGGLTLRVFLACDVGFFFACYCCSPPLFRCVACAVRD